MPARMTSDVLRLRRGLDDLREILFHLGDRQSAKAIVPAERDDQHPDVFLERPIEPPKAAGRGVARDTRIDDFEMKPDAVDLFLQQDADRTALSRRPRPAVRLSPSTTIFGRSSSVFDAGAGGVAACEEARRRNCAACRSLNGTKAATRP